METEGARGDDLPGLRLDAREQDPRDWLYPGTGRELTPEVAIGPDGSLHAPAGETFVFCAECGAARWFATRRTFGRATITRMVCVGCGNEVRGAD